MKICTPESSHISQLRKLWQESFSDTEFFVNVFFQTAFSPKRSRCVICDEQIAAALYWFSCTWGGMRLAYLYAVATAGEFRGRGICRRLMEDTHAHLKELGYDAVILVPGSDSLFGFYERMGYRVCSSIRELNCKSADGGVMMERIDKHAYGKLRRMYLPENGVLQEAENLDLLECTEEFYQGEDFLLAGHCENGEYVGVELLGNVVKAPQILHSLGCETGVFRTTGEERPFAMCFPLRAESVISDMYFGIAFDL